MIFGWFLAGLGGFWLVWVVFGWFGWFLAGLGGFWLVWVVFGWFRILAVTGVAEVFVILYWVWRRPDDVASLKYLHTF